MFRSHKRYLQSLGTRYTARLEIWLGRGRQAPQKNTLQKMNLRTFLGDLTRSRSDEKFSTSMVLRTSKKEILLMRTLHFWSTTSCSRQFETLRSLMSAFCRAFWHVMYSQAWTSATPFSRKKRTSSQISTGPSGTNSSNRASLSQPTSSHTYCKWRLKPTTKPKMMMPTPTAWATSSLRRSPSK